MPELTDLDRDYANRRRVLDGWVQKRRQIAQLEAEATSMLIEQFDIHDLDVAESPYHRDAIYRSMVAEFSAAGRIPRGSIEYAFADARALRDNLPATRAAFAAGDITNAHVREIVRAAAVINEAIANRKVNPSVRHLYEAAALVFAERETAARTRAHVQEVAASLVGETIIERHRRAAQERMVSVRSVDDGLALLTAVLPEWVAAAIMDRLTQLSHAVIDARGTSQPRPDLNGLETGMVDPALTGAGAPNSGSLGISLADADLIDRNAVDPEHDVEHTPDTRTLDQVRADTLADMLLTAAPSETVGDALGNVQARIQVTIAATTLAGIDDSPAQLDGHGSLDPDIARALAGRNDGWTRLFADPTGLIVQTDTYTPTTPMKRSLRARDQYCRFPGCRVPVHRCQIDHNHDHAKGGKTTISNLAHFCTAHHSLKHPDIDERHRWTAQQQPDGTITWFSPLKRAYEDRPARRVMFA